MNTREYILFHFETLYRVPEEIRVDLRNEQPEKLVWPDKGEEFFSKDKPFQLDAREEMWLDRKIFLPFSSDQEQIIEIRGNKASLCFDVFTSSFMILSGWQEDRQNDVGSRITAKNLWQNRYKCVRLPIVNYFFDILKTALEQAWNVEIPLRSKRTSVFMSHDIVKVNSGWKNAIEDEMKSFNIGNIMYLMIRKISGKDIWKNLEYIMNLEENYDVHSTFFLMGRKGSNYADYDISKDPYHSWIKEIQSRGFEAGLLASNGCHNSAHKLGSDKRRFKYKVYGNRFHELRYKTKNSPRSLEKNKFSYDSSMGMYDEVGFRNGYCHPFVPWDFKHDRPSAFVEVPLMMNDNAMIRRKYLNVTPKDSLNVFHQIAIESEKFKGVISMNWSNFCFAEFKYNEWRKAVERIIKNADEQGFKFKSGYQVSLQSHEDGLSQLTGKSL